MSEQNISSAEITAYMRSQEPTLSHDNISRYLVSEDGIKKRHEVLDVLKYPLSERKFIVRAGYFYEQALALLQTGNYDSCISFASGFSMLTYLLAKETKNDIKFYDTDLENILALRKQRIQENADLFDSAILKKIQSKVVDVTTLTETSLKQLFSDCKKPLFIIEGLTYFLDRDVVTHLIQQMMMYEGSAIILDYWPENSLEISAIFKRIMHQLQGFIAEDLKSFVTSEQLQLLHNHYQSITDISILEVDKVLSAQQNTAPVLINQNEVFPIRVLVAK